MTKPDSSGPVFELFVGDNKVAHLHDPKREEMFWCSYRIAPVSEDADRILRDEAIWNEVRFTVRARDGGIPNAHTFTGGDLGSYCRRETDRLSFRSLWPIDEDVAQPCAAGNAGAMKLAHYAIIVVAATLLLEAAILSGSFALTIAALPILWPITLFRPVVSSLWCLLLVIIPAYCFCLSLPLLMFSIQKRKVWLIGQAALVAFVIVLFFVVGRKFVAVPFM